MLAIKSYLEGTLVLTDSEITPYSELESREKKLQDAYCIFYLKLKGHDPETKEEDIIQTFLRLQEGTPLNKAEKINAYRGIFKDTFRITRETHPLFNFLGNDKRFRFRQLAAELLLLELEGDFENKVFALQKDGEITPPFLTKFGYHIVKQISKTEVPQNRNNESYQTTF